jgi:hypothetical protein
VLSGLPAQPYHILVSQADAQPGSQVWSFGFDAPIPTAPVPLIGSDEQVPLPLQAAYMTIYAARNFQVRLPYQTDPEPPLTEAQRTTIHTQLVQAGCRG